jgi:O-antigen/teichoic acid export membrane protein
MRLPPQLTISTWKSAPYGALGSAIRTKPVPQASAVRRPWLAHPGAYVVVQFHLSAFGVVGGLLIPALLGPAEFGRYTIAELIARYLLISDFGLLLLLDRRVPRLLAMGNSVAADNTIQHVLWARALLGAAVGAALLIAMFCLSFTGNLELGLGPTLFAVASGTLALLAIGPISAWRASSRYRALALSAAIVNLGLSLPRVVGAWVGGVVGCFAALAMWGGLSTIILYRYLPLRVSALPSFRTGCALVAEGLPLFAASFGWSLYLPENRWAYAIIAGHDELGQFAFASSIMMAVATTLGIAGNVYYPKLAGRIATNAPYTFSTKLLRDLSIVNVAAGFCCFSAILLLNTGVRVAYPRFVEAVPSARILLASGPPMLLAGWLTQLIIAVGKRPWVETVIIYPASLLAVAAGIFLGHASGGMVGAAEGSVVGTLVCPMLQVLVLRSSAIMRLCHALMLILVVVAMTMALGTFAIFWE